MGHFWLYCSIQIIKNMNKEILKAIKLLNYHSLSVISTDRQINNETIMVEDDFLGTRYTVHASGYARKRTFTWPYFSPGESAVPGNENNHYQLNKTKIRYENRTYAGYPKGKVFQIGFTERILLPGKYVELAQMVVNAAYTERKCAEAEKSLRDQGKTDSWFTKRELMKEYKRMTNK